MPQERKHPTNNPRSITWVVFTRRTEDPKLRWLQDRLRKAGIKSKREGRSFHGPLLWVPEGRLEDAWHELPMELDELPDDDPYFQKRHVDSNCPIHGAGKPDPDSVLTMQEVADHLKLSLYTVREMGRAGKLPIVRFGRRVRVRFGALRQWVEAQEKGGK